MKKRIVVIALAIMGMSSANAQMAKTEITKPGDASLPSSKEELEKLATFEKGTYKYSVEDFFKKPKASNFQLSPDGKFLSYQEKDVSGKNHVYVKNTKTGEVVLSIKEKEELIREYSWINNERLVYSMDKGGNENYHIYATNLDGSNAIDLTPYDGVKAGILKTLKEQKDYLIISMNKDNPQVNEPYKVNVVTGQLEKLHTNDDVSIPIVGYDFDKDGNLKGFHRIVNGLENHYYYKSNGSKTYEHFNNANWDEIFNVLSFNYATENPDDAYILTNLDSDKIRVVLYDFKEKKILKEIYSNDTYDATILSLSRKRNYEIDYVGFNGEKVEVLPVSNTFKKYYQKLKKEFGDQQFYLIDRTEAEDKYLILVTSDKIQGKYFQYDVKQDKVTFLFDLLPQLKEEDMAGMLPITFKSRDGLTIHGYITLPKEALNGKKVPLIVNPHGGPQSVRDSWSFIKDDQLFASRGYATLHVNFRISGGYGKEFMRAGFKQIGRKVMDDIEDGVQYVIEQGWIDKDRMAIYGASHGGYATLMGLVKTPDLYACGVDYVGVSNVETILASFPAHWKPYLKMFKETWYDLDNPKEAKISRSVSPIYHVDKIKKPLFVVQGANDIRVTIKEADQIVTALRAKNFQVPYMVKYNEGHGFGREENRIELYKAMMGFFAQHLKK